MKNFKHKTSWQPQRAKNFASPVAASETTGHHHWSHRPLHLASEILKK
jgi:hypothetical protein